MTHLAPVLRPVLGSPFRRSDVYRIAGALPALHLSPRLRGDWVDLISGTDLTTFSRANTQPTYELDGAGGLVGFSSGQRAIGYSPETGVRGGSIFGQRTQLLASPQSIGGSGWQNQNSIGVTLNTTDVQDPLGGNTATKLVYGAANSQSIQTQTLTANQHQFSVFLRTASGTATINLYVFLAASPFTLIGNLPVTVTTSWQRFNVLTSTATAAAYNVGINMPNSGTTVYAWGANLTAGSVLYPYIGGAITCPADVLTIETAQLGSIWQPGSTIIASYSRQAVTGADTPAVAAVHDGTTSNRILLGYETASVGRLQVFTAGVSQGSATPSASGNRRTMAATAGSTSGVSINGGADSTFSVASMPTVNQIRLGADATGSNPGQLYLHDFLIFPPGSAASRRVQLSAAL